MNKELREWLAEHGELEKKVNGNDEKQPAPISGKCQICGARSAKYQCMKCNKVICPSCFWGMFGLCESCISPDIIKKIRNAKKDYGIDHIK